MTAQVHDNILIDEKEFSIVGVNGGELFAPQSIGIQPIPVMSSCWRGYICQYEISNEKLILDELRLFFGIYETDGKKRKFIHQKGPAINGVNPCEPQSNLPTYFNLYEGVNLEIQFTGGLLAGSDFIQGLYVHMGFHPAWKYQTVFELIFDTGKVQVIRDVSRPLCEIRQRMLELPLKPDLSKVSKEEGDAWVEKTFMLNYFL